MPTINPERTRLLAALANAQRELVDAEERRRRATIEAVQGWVGLREVISAAQCSHEKVRPTGGVGGCPRPRAVAMPREPPESEAWFDEYVRSHGQDPGEPEPDLGIEKSADRLITWNGHQVVCEIKQFEASPFDRLIGTF